MASSAAATRDADTARRAFVDGLIGGPCSAGQLAELLGVSERTVFRYVDAGVFPPRGDGGWSGGLCLELYRDHLLVRAIAGGHTVTDLVDALGIDDADVARAWRWFGAHAIGLGVGPRPWEV